MRVSVVYFYFISFTFFIEVISGSALAREKNERDFEPTPNEILAGPILIVTHAEKRWDQTESAKKGIDHAIDVFQKNSESKIIFLAEANYEENPDNSYTDRRTPSWYTNLSKPTFNLQSNGGEHRLKISSPKIVMAGGNFGLCQTTSMMDVIRGYSGVGPLTIELPIDAVFSGWSGTAMTLRQEEQLLGGNRFNTRLFEELNSFRTTFETLDVIVSVKRGKQVLGKIGSGSKQVEISFVDNVSISVVNSQRRLAFVDVLPRSLGQIEKLSIPALDRLEISYETHRVTYGSGREFDGNVTEVSFPKLNEDECVRLKEVYFDNDVPCEDVKTRTFTLSDFLPPIVQATEGKAWSAGPYDPFSMNCWGTTYEFLRNAYGVKNYIEMFFADGADVYRILGSDAYSKEVAEFNTFDEFEKLDGVLSPGDYILVMNKNSSSLVHAAIYLGGTLVFQKFSNSTGLMKIEPFKNTLDLYRQWKSTTFKVRRFSKIKNLPSPSSFGVETKKIVLERNEDKGKWTIR